jgi:hypothetical protein
MIAVTTSGMIMIAVLVLITAGIAFSLHLILRGYFIAVVVSGIVADGLLLLVSVPGRWDSRMTLVMIVTAVIAMALSAMIGAPSALARKRKADAVQGFLVLPPDQL